MEGLLARELALVAPYLKVADEVWIATALLHRENSASDHFTVAEIVSRVQRENLFGRKRASVYAHAYAHCVANRPPSPTGYRMLFATGKDTRRLFRMSDEAHPKRAGKIAPAADEISADHLYLLEWFDRSFHSVKTKPNDWLSGLFELQGLGQEIWAGVDPDEYVRKLREDWD